MVDRSIETLNISCLGGGLADHDAVFLPANSEGGIKLPFASVDYLSKIAVKGCLLWLPEGLQPKNDQSELACTAQFSSSDLEYIVRTIESPAHEFAVGIEDLLKPIKKSLAGGVRPDIILETEENNVVLESGPLKLDRGVWEVSTDEGKLMKLTKNQFLVLEYLMKNSGIVCERGAIYESVWGNTLNPTDRSIDVTIRRIRIELERIGQNKALIDTRHRIGYLYNPNPENKS